MSDIEILIVGGTILFAMYMMMDKKHNSKLLKLRFIQPTNTPVPELQTNKDTKLEQQPTTTGTPPQPPTIQETGTPIRETNPFIYSNKKQTVIIKDEL